MEYKSIFPLNIYPYDVKPFTLNYYGYDSDEKDIDERVDCFITALNLTVEKLKVSYHSIIFVPG